MSDAIGTGAAPLRGRVERALARGQRCASCFVQVVAEEGVEVPPELRSLARALERGPGGTGTVCGVYLAALLARSLQGDATPGPGREAAPWNEWLEAFTPSPPATPAGGSVASLERQLSEFARSQYGGIGCLQISGAEWPAAGPGVARLYAARGGVERCTRFIVEAARAFLDPALAAAR